jgi:ribosomal protein S18 acetylase RimI-like enzyme
MSPGCTRRRPLHPDDGTPPADVLAEANHAALLRHQGRFPGALVDDQPTHLRVWTGLASGFFNAVARARWTPDVAIAAVRAIRTDLSARRVPWRWYLASSGGSEELVRLLKAAGLMPVPAQTPMLLPLDERVLPRLVSRVEPVPGLHVSQVRERPAMEAWVAARAASNGWSERTAGAWLTMHLGLGFEESEPLQHLVARMGGRPVGTASVFLERDGTAGIYHIEVVPEARGRGIATWLTAAAIGLAADQGAARVVLTSTQAALGLYRRLGFTARGSFTYFIDPVLGA